MRVLLAIHTPSDRGRLGLERANWLSGPVALTAVCSALHVGNDVKIIDRRLEGRR
jgi:hypothetical protein